jgi:hypothetical protein
MVTEDQGPRYWEGRYRDRVLGISRKPGRLGKWWINWPDGGETGPFHSVKEALAAAKCKRDWDEWLKQWTQKDKRAWRLIYARVLFALRHEDYDPGKWGVLEMVDRIREWIQRLPARRPDTTTSPVVIWENQGLDLRERFAEDMLRCYGKGATARMLRNQHPKEPRETSEPKPSPKSPRKRKAPGATHQGLARGPVGVPERLFGHCKTCKVCLAFDVNHGCCTVCGRQLVRNPGPRMKARRKRARRRGKDRAQALRRLMRL